MSFLRLPFTRLSTRASFQQLTQAKHFSQTTYNMSNTPSSNMISETAKQEGGPTHGSTSAKMQSEVGKTQNFEQAAQEIGSKMQRAPETVTSEVRLISVNIGCDLTNIPAGRCLPQVP